MSVERAEAPLESTGVLGEPSDGQLVAAKRRGSDSAYGELVRRHQIAAFRLLLGFVGNGDDAERLCEQLFLEAARRVDELEDPEAFQPWLVRLARAVVKKDEERRKKSAPRKRQRPPAPDAKTLVKQEVQDVLAELSSDERLSLVLADLEEESYESIARTLGTSVDEAAELVSSARTKFVRAMSAQSKPEAGPRTPELALGQVVDGRFRVGELLGKGGMGAVYRATDLETGAPVALKTLLPNAAEDPTLRRRFVREAEVIARIQHPNFVRFIHHGKAPEEPAYVVMELLDGRALNDVIHDHKHLGLRRALHVTQHLLLGLRHAHDLGVVHRDMKPENVMLVEHELDPYFPKILDLGIAKLIGDENAAKTGITDKGELFGTPLYISPELLRGEELDGRADLYAVTVMLFEMLTSRPPFYSTNSMGVFAMHLATPPPSLKAAAPELALPPTLEQLVARGLAKEPAQRIGSAGEYLQLIEEILAVEPAEAAPTGPVPPAGAEARRAHAQAPPTESKSTAAVAPVTKHHASRITLRRLRELFRSRSARAAVALAVVALSGLFYWVARHLSSTR